MNLAEESRIQFQERKLRENGSIRSIFMHADRVDKWLMAFGFVGSVFDGFSERLPLIFISRTISAIGSSSKLDREVLRRNVNESTVAMLYLACVSFVACFLEGYCWTRTGDRQAARTRAKYLKAVLRQDLAYFDLDATSTSEVITSISNDTLVIQEVIGEKVPFFVSNLSAFIGGYLVAFILVWQLAMVALPLLILLVIPGWLCGKCMMDLAGKIRSEYNKAGTIAEMAISSIRTVYAFVGEKKTLEEFSEALNRSMKLGLRQGLVKGLAIGSNATVFAIWSLLSYYGSRLVMSDRVQGGAAFAAGNSIVNGGLALGACLSTIKDMAEACCAGKHIMEVIQRVPKIDSEDTEGIVLEDVSGQIEFKQVCFSYPSRPKSVVLKNFSLIIPQRKSVAIVGASGSGKSTVLSLLQRFYDPLEGEILLDGITINKLQLKWLRSQMALVSQEPSLFSTSIKENILFGKEDAQMEDVLEASKTCDAHDFISQLPQGYDTQVGERGIQLSGGQKQRIAIARAIIRKPQILLLDEATSALDSESERSVQDAIENVVVGRTTMIIAHRLSTIKNVDIIAVVENGQVSETGSHDELMKDENGLFASLVRLQRMEIGRNKKENNRSSSSSSNKAFNNANKSNHLSGASKSNLANFATPRLDSLTQRNDNISKDSKSSKPSFRRLIGLNKPEWKQAVIGCLSAITFGAVQPLYGFVMGATVSVYFSTDHNEIKEKIRNSALWFFGLAVFSLLINLSQHYSFAYMGEHLTKRIRERMFSKMLTFEVGWFDKDENSSSVVCSRLAKDANVVRSLVGDRMSLLMQAASSVTIAWTMGLVISWRLAVVSIAVQPLIIACIYTRRVLLKRMSGKAIKEQNESTKVAAEAVSNLRTVTAFSSQKRILKMLKKAQEGPRKESIRQSWIAGIALGCSASIKTCNRCLNNWYGGKLVSEGYINPRQVFQTLLIVVTTGRVIADAGSMTTNLAKGWDAIQSVFAMLDKDTNIEPENLKSYQPEMVEGDIELSDVHFAYPTRPQVMIFQGFSIKVQAGKSMALVGKSGSGKSTIIGLIERFYDPLKGTVKIDGRDIRSYHLRTLRNYIALVNQEPTLFAGTVRENITYGVSRNISEAEIIEAARTANVHDFIMRQKDGYETWCGHRGLQLSGGQKQRIAIARAILRNPAMLLLDEATSALDGHSERVVQDAIEHTMMGRTSIVVAHRLCTIQNCDQIAVLDNGIVVEKGTHSFLMAKGPTGAYHSLVSLQTAKSELIYQASN